MKKYELEDMDIIALMYDSPELPLLFKGIIDNNMNDAQVYDILEGIFLAAREQLENKKREEDYE